MVCGGECPSLEAGLAQTNTQLRETGVLTVATVLTRSRVFTTSRALIAPHVVSIERCFPSVGQLPAVQAPNLANWLRLC